MVDVDPNSVIPVQAVLKLIVDRQGSDQVEQALKNQEEGFSRVEQTIGRIGTGLDGVAKTVTEMIGIGGLGGLLDKFVKVETSASNVALAMGRVMGGPSTYHGIGQELLGVQGRTGVSTGEQEAALRAIAMSVGLNPKPGQAGMLAEVIAGYSRVTGMNPGVLGAIVGPMLQATGRDSSPYSSAYTLGEARSNLSAFPGSQIEAILPGIGRLAEAGGFGAGMHGGYAKPGAIAAQANVLAQSNPLFHGENATQALESIGSIGQGAWRNPQLYAFLKLAGINYWESQENVNNPAYVEKVVAEANRFYPGTQNRMKRNMLYQELGGGQKGALALEAFERHDAHHEAQHQAGITVRPPQFWKEAFERQHAQTATTPESQLQKILGKVEGFAFGSVPGAIATGAGLLFGGNALLKLPGAVFKVLGRGASALLGGGEGAAEAGGATLGDVAGGAVTAGILPTILSLVDPGGSLDLLGQLTGGGLGTSREGARASANAYKARILRQALSMSPAAGERYIREHGGVRAGAEGVTPGGNPAGLLHLYNEALGVKGVPGVLKDAERKFGQGWLGAHWESDPKERKTAEAANAYLRQHLHGAGLTAASEDIKKLREYEQLGPQGYAAKQQNESTQKFSEAVAKFVKAVEHEGTRGAAYNGGAGMHNASYVGAPAVASMASTVPGMVMAAFLSGGRSTTPMGAAPATTGAGTQMAANITGSNSGWNSVLEKYSGGSYGLAHVEQLAGEHPGGGAHPGDRSYVEQMARKYGIPFNILWGIYGAESSFGKAASNFGLIGQFPGTGTSGNFNTDARMSAQDLAALARALHLNVHVHVGGSKVHQQQVRVGGQRPVLV